MKECPRCHKMTLHDTQAFNCLSHRDGKTYICEKCGDEESMIDLAIAEPDKVEREFVATHHR